MIRNIHQILILIQAVYGVYTIKNDIFQLNYTDYISVHKYLIFYICLLYRVFHDFRA